MDGKELRLAKYYINSYSIEEFGNIEDFSDLKNIGLGYTTLTDDELDAQITCNLIDMKIVWELDWKPNKVIQFKTPAEMLQYLRNLNWDDLFNEFEFEEDD